MIAVADDGALLAAAARLDEKIDLPLRLDREEAEIHALYYGPGLDQLGFAPGPLAISPDDSCGRLLPTPDEAYKSVARAPFAREDELPDRVKNLRFAFDTASCPSLGAMDVDIRCGNPACVGALRQDHCDLVLDLSRCSRDPISLPIDRFGALCLAASEQFGRCTAKDPPSMDIAHSFACDGGTLGACDLDFYVHQDSAPIAVETKKILDVEVPSIVDMFPRPPYGWLGDLAILEDRVAVTSYGNVIPKGSFCVGAPEGQVHFLDLDSMEIIGTATTPSCFGNIAPDPVGDGFVGTFGNDPPVIARFDKRGAMIASVGMTGIDPPELLFANSIAVDPGPPALAVVTAANEIWEQRRSYFFAVDLTSMSVDPLTGRAGKNTRELQTFAPGVLSALEDIDNYMLFIDLATRRQSRAGALGLLNAGVGQLYSALDGSTLVLSMNGMAGGVFTFELTGDLKGRSRPFELWAETWAIAPWPADRRLFLAGISVREEPRLGYLALVDVARPRFLPGRVRVGSGPAAIGRLHEDRQGMLWAVLPWTAEVIRVRAAP